MGNWTIAKKRFLCLIAANDRYVSQNRLPSIDRSILDFHLCLRIAVHATPIDDAVNLNRMNWKMCTWKKQRPMRKLFEWIALPFIHRQFMNIFLFFLAPSKMRVFFFFFLDNKERELRMGFDNRIQACKIRSKWSVYFKYSHFVGFFWLGEILNQTYFEINSVAAKLIHWNVTLAIDIVKPIGKWATLNLVFGNVVCHSIYAVAEAKRFIGITRTLEIFNLINSRNWNGNWKFGAFWNLINKLWISS